MEHFTSDKKPTSHQMRAYTKPTLAKGPRLTAVTADSAGTPQGDMDSICWVARAAFGEHDFRWMIFRAWLIEDAPRWFRSAYLRHGPLIASKIEGRDSIRAVVRNLMMNAIRRKLNLS